MFLYKIFMRSIETRIFFDNVFLLIVLLMFELKQVTVAYNKDPSPIKLNLGVGAYRTEVDISFQNISKKKKKVYTKKIASD